MLKQNTLKRRYSNWVLICCCVLSFYSFNVCFLNLDFVWQIDIFENLFFSDIDECDESVCAQNCINTLGSYTCYCSDGYIMNQTDKNNCIGNFYQLLSTFHHVRTFSKLWKCVQCSFCHIVTQTTQNDYLTRSRCKITG